MALDIEAYIKAGYTPQSYSRLDTALSFVEHCCVMCPCRFNERESQIECNIGDSEMEMWVASGYFWENDYLFKRG